jgi:alpha-D-ribose 1-methylphosphonate 5-phosphate C-P lyase
LNFLPKEPGAQYWGAFNCPRDASGLTAKSTAVRLGAQDAEAQIVVPVVRIVVVPVRGASVLSRIVPATAAFHAVRPRGRAHAVHYYENYGIAQVTDGR